MNRRVADSALLPYERQGSIVTYVTAVASAEKGARCALIFILGGSLHWQVNDRQKQCRQTSAMEPNREEGLQNKKSEHRQIIQDPKMNNKTINLQKNINNAKLSDTPKRTAELST